ncbi:hypothetical protein [Streptomyces sp. NPDC051909]|uniref:hypothetical protein n=1 Tax=Streptomyces sp. NPDC051909 TaxID=3154944 RepID=UPI00341EC076
MNPCARSLPGAGLVRALLLTWLSVVMSACGHSVATGVSPSWSAITVGSAAVALVVAPLARRRMTTAANSGVLAALQIGLHAFFSATMPKSPMPHTMGAMHGGTTPLPWAAVLPTIPMICAHVVAAAGVAWLLRGGDAAVSRLRELAHLYGSDVVAYIRHTLNHLVRQGRCRTSAPALRLPRARSWPAATPLGPQPLLAHEVTRRGPPRWMAVLG